MVLVLDENRLESVLPAAPLDDFLAVSLSTIAAGGAVTPNVLTQCAASADLKCTRANDTSRAYSVAARLSNGAAGVARS